MNFCLLCLFYLKKGRMIIVLLENAHVYITSKGLPLSLLSAIKLIMPSFFGT